MRLECTGGAQARSWRARAHGARGWKRGRAGVREGALLCAR
ncbi:hypothetical protein CRG98_048645, partial [Punica granatum]